MSHTDSRNHQPDETTQFDATNCDASLRRWNVEGRQRKGFESSNDKEGGQGNHIALSYDKIHTHTCLPLISQQIYVCYAIYFHHPLICCFVTDLEPPRRLGHVGVRVALSSSAIDGIIFQQNTRL